MVDDPIQVPDSLNDQPNNSAESQLPITKSPVLTVHLYSWATPVVSLVMLVIGIFAGYFIRQSGTSSNTSPAPTSISQNQPAVTQPVSSGNDNAALMSAVAAQTRHYLGNPDAPVTMIELSDFK